MNGNTETIKIELGQKAKDLSAFWDFFYNLPGNSGIDWPTDMRKKIREFEIPLWVEDLEVAIQIDKRFETHFTRVIQLATWAMERDSINRKYGPKNVGNDCEKEIVDIRGQLLDSFCGFLKNTIKTELSKSNNVNPSDFEISGVEEILKHIVCMVALYHDIGKRIATSRHPDEGYFYLKNVIDDGKRKILSELIFDINIDGPAAIKNNSEALKKRLLSEIWEIFLTIIRYHDCPGVLSTGEASLGILVDALSYHTKSIEKQVFILLFLGFTNTIDASSSIGGKSLGDDGGTYVEKVKNNIEDLTLFNYVLKEKASQKLGHLIKLDKNEFEYIDKMKLEEEIFRVEKAEYRAVSRIERLVKENASTELKRRIEKDIIREAIVGAVGRTNIQEFCRRMAAVVKLDYMLPFVGWMVRYPEKIWEAITKKGEQITKLPERVAKWANKLNVETENRDNNAISNAREMLKALLDRTVYSALHILMGKIFVKAIIDKFDLLPKNYPTMGVENLKRRVESFFITRVTDIKDVELKKIPQNNGIDWIPIEYQSTDPDITLDFVEITEILTCLGHYFNSNEDKRLREIEAIKEEIKNTYAKHIMDNAHKVRNWGTDLFPSDLEHFSISFRTFFDSCGPIIPIEKIVDLKQWFSDTNLVKHYLSIDPTFMATHIIALLWQLVQKYPPQKKYPEPELSRMGISMGRLTNPEQFAEKIVPLIVASGTPSHAYTWIEEEVTIWHFS